MKPVANITEFYQRTSERRPTMPPLLDRREGTGADVRPIDARQIVSSDVGALVVQALDAAHLTKAAAARVMGISLSLFARQLTNLDNQHVSLQRLDRLPDAFWWELFLLQVERRGLGRVERRVIVDEARERAR